jgi:hypothetical protein
VRFSSRCRKRFAAGEIRHPARRPILGRSITRRSSNTNWRIAARLSVKLPMPTNWMKVWL